MSVGAPPVDAVAPGVWSVLLPLTDSPVGSVFVYLLRHEGGLLLIDTGYDDEPSRAALARALAEIGHDLSEITSIVLTHNHPDHVGMAESVRRDSGATVYAPAADAEQARTGKQHERAGSPLPALLLWTICVLTFACGVVALTEHPEWFGA